jgi:hypothetical protein
MEVDIWSFLINLTKIHTVAVGLIWTQTQHVFNVLTRSSFQFKNKEEALEE